MVFKIGLPRLYSYVHGAYNSNIDKPFALGFGFGSLIPLGKRLYFNPEIGGLTPLSSENRMSTTTLTANIRYSINSRLQLAVGPSFVWSNSSKGDTVFDPFFSLLNHKVDDRNRFLLGLRASVSFNITELL